MKKSLLAFSLAVSTLAVACGGGSSSPPPPPSAIGVWSGNVVSGGTTTAFAPALVADGTMRAYTTVAGLGATGTWTLTGSTVVMIFTFDGTSTAWTFTGALSGSSLAGAGTNGTSTVTFSLVPATDAGAGIWKGKYGIGSAAQTLDMLFLLFPGSIAELHDGATLASTAGTGTWSMTGAVVSAGVAPGGGTPSVLLAGTVAGDTMTGTFGAAPSSTGGGTMTLTRQR